MAEDNSWVHCNKCFDIPSATNNNFFFTTCGHIICHKCATQNDNNVQDGICKACGRNAKYTIINRNMRPDILELFKPSKQLLYEHFKKLSIAINFQEYQRNRLKKHQQELFLNKIQSLEAQLDRQVEVERTWFEEKQHLRNELQREQDNNNSLASRLSETMRSLNGFINSPSLHSNNNTSSNDSAPGRQFHQYATPGFSFARKIRTRSLKPVVCAQYSRPLSVRSQPSGFQSPSSSTASHPPQSIGTGPLMTGRITKGPVLPRSFGIHPTPPSSMFL